MNKTVIGRVGYPYKGKWDSTKTYNKRHVVSNGYSTFFSLVDGNVGNALPTTDEEEAASTYWRYFTNAQPAKEAAEAAEEATEKTKTATDNADAKADLAATNAALAASKANTAQVLIDQLTSQLATVTELKEKMETLYSQLDDAIEAAESAKASAGSAANPVLQRPASIIVQASLTAAVGSTVDISPESVLPDTANASMLYQLKSGTATVTPEGKVTSDTAGSVVVYVIPTLSSAIYAEVTITFRESVAVTDEEGNTLTDEEGNEISSD